MKKLIAIFLILVMSATVLAACSGTDEDKNNGDGSVNNNMVDEYKNTDGEYVPKFEVVDQQGKEFRIIVRGNGGTYQSDDFTTNSELYGELLDDAVQKRNDRVESIYNVKIMPIKSETIDDDIRNNVGSGLGSYDAIMPTLRNLAICAQDGYLLDLYEQKYFDANAPWYDKNCSEAFSFGGKLFFTTGDLTILNKVNTPSILFNKEMVAKNELENPYELVEKNEWTFDKMVEMAKKVKVINTSDGSYSKDNIYGMVSAVGDALGFYGASGESICKKDADDYPYLSIGREQRSINIAQKVLSTLTSADWIILAQDFNGQPDIWEASFEVFYNGRALFRPSAFSATTKLRSRSNIMFGILPMPLMDETQEKYYSYCGTGETVGFAIPYDAPDPDFSMYMIDACSAYAKTYITHAYYEVNLKAKDVRDDESEAMLDIIFDNKVYDIGNCYNFGGFNGVFSDLMSSKSDNVVSAIEANKTAAETAIEKLKEDFGD